MGSTGAASLPPIGNGLRYTETNSNNFGPNVYCDLERTDIIQISKNSFYCNRFSAESVHKTMGVFRSHFL